MYFLSTRDNVDELEKFEKEEFCVSFIHVNMLKSLYLNGNMNDFTIIMGFD